MKVSDSLNKTSGLGVSASKTRAGKTEEKSGIDKTVAGSASDNVTLSSEAQALSHQAHGDNTFDAKKVEEIKAAIASGQFQINPGRIADGLIDTVKDLLSAQKG